MAKQVFTFSLSAQQVREAVESYVALMVDPKTHDVAVVALSGALPSINVVVTRRRAVRKPKLATAPKAAAA